MSTPNRVNATLLAEAVSVAKAADVVVLALGIAECGSYLGDASYPLHGCSNTAEFAQYVEAEGHDRPRLDLPPAQVGTMDTFQHMLHVGMWFCTLLCGAPLGG